jgi:hypothetical protein
VGLVDERDEELGGATAVEQATGTLFHAIGLADETCDTLASTGIDDLISADRLIDVLMWKPGCAWSNRDRCSKRPPSHPPEPAWPPPDRSSPHDSPSSSTTPTSSLRKPLRPR